MVRVDWITVAAQLINFLVLVWLLKKFLYQPVLDAMQARQERINESLEQARRQAEEGARLASQLRDEQSAYEAERTQRLNTMREEVAAERHALMQTLRDERDAYDRQWRRQAQRDIEESDTRLRQSLAAEAATIASRAVADLADVDLQTHVIRRFADRLQRLDESQQQGLLDSGGLTVLTALPLGDAQRDLVVSTLRDLVAAESEAPEVAFHVDDTIGMGISVRSTDFEVGWNLREYMDQLQSHLLHTQGLTLANQSADQAEQPNA